MIERAIGVVSAARNGWRAARVLSSSGLLRPVRPDTMAHTAVAVLRDGLSPATAYAYGAARFPNEAAIVDERGTLTFSEVARRVSVLAAFLEDSGIGAGDRVGLLCRNSRAFVLTAAALSSLGADVVLLNVSFAAPALAATIEQYAITAVVYDEEFSAECREAAAGLRRFVTWSSESEPESEPEPPDPSLDALTGRTRRPLRLAPRPASRFVLLTSGTTGRPKGAARSVPSTLEPLTAMLGSVPLRVRDVTLVASPLFHAWGFGNLGLAMALSSTVVLRRRFEAEAVMADISEHRVRVLIAVPVMLQRLVDLPEEARRGFDTSSLEAVVTSGSALPGDLATRFMDTFGDILYNVYGSTEVAYATIAGPRHLRAAPGTAGLAPGGTEVRIVDGEGRAAPAGGVGRIVVRNRMLAARAGRDGGGTVPEGFLATGDLGHLDDAGLLHVDGREDDMIVSGGENVYPREVEDVISAHPAVLEVSVVGVPDAEFGQRLRALVVRRQGASLTKAEVRGLVRSRLARFKVPRDVLFVDELSRTETGKPLHRPRVAGEP